MIGELVKIAGQCDGVRCDMAMLVLPEVFERTWGQRAPLFWPTATQRVRERVSGFVFLAEVYWDMEWTLRQRVKPSTIKVDEKRVAQLVVALDSEVFRERQRASKELAELRDLAGPLLRKVLDTKPSAEVERRILGILKQYEVPTVGTDLLRALRSIEILEAIGDSDAQQVLETLAKGLPEALVTREAQAALRRKVK